MSDAIEGRRIFLGMPGYGKQTSAAGRALWNACADRSRVAKVAYQNGSLLAQNFNSLWCAALNIVHEGGQIHYFAMLHDDIGAEDFWLDKLIDELEANDLDILGVVAPIKDTRGMTSLALDQEEGDGWMPFARLSMRDVYELPETFTSEDLGGRPLLLNTGCWVCRFDPSWVKQVHFQVSDRIVYNEAIDRFQAQAWPEDWYFSRRANELGLRIGATRKINLIHQGDMIYTNMQPWGDQPFDVEAVKVSPVPLAFPYDVAGWLAPEEGRELGRLAAGKRVLEIGSFCGLSTICLARTAKSVTAVDYFDGRATAVPGDTFAAFSRNIERYGASEKISIQSPDDELEGEFDLAFIDGAHDFDSVSRDIERASAVLAPGGLLVFHDYRSPIDPGVTAAVDELLANGGELLSTQQTLAVVKPPAQVPLEV